MIPILQVAIGPAVLISGVGLLILSLPIAWDGLLIGDALWFVNCAITPNLNVPVWRNSSISFHAALLSAAVYHFRCAVCIFRCRSDYCPVLYRSHGYRQRLADRCLVYLLYDISNYFFDRFSAGYKSFPASLQPGY